MKKLYLILFIYLSFFALPIHAKTVSVVKPKPVSAWKPLTPPEYTPITWAKAPGIATYFKAPSSNGSMDFLTRIYLPQNQIGFITATNTPLDWGVSDPDFASSGQDTTLVSPYRNYAFTRLAAETSKNIKKEARFIWNAPFFNITNPISDLSMALKSTIGTTTLISSGSRPNMDMNQDRRLLIINNKTGKAFIQDFDPVVFVSSTLGDQAIEGFAPTVMKSDNASGATGRLFIGVSTSSQELIIYCSRQATITEASRALTLAGVPVENQLEADGGGSAACGYNLPGQFFVEPTRALPLLMGATTILARGNPTTNDLNIRNIPSTKGVVVGKISKSEVVKIFEEKDGWYRIDQNQWVSKKLIKKI